MRSLRTATPMGDWRSFKYTCDDSGGHENDDVGLANDAAAARRPYLYLVQDSVGAALHVVAFGEEGVLVYHAEKIIVLKMIESTDVFLPGDRVYWDPTTRLVTPTFDATYYWIGMATEPADADDLEVEIDLNGNHAEAEAVL